MQSLWPFFFGLLVGVGVGAFGIARWYVKTLKNPDVARDVLRSIYKNSHAHWLQVSQTDTRAVCPCCGWTEKEGKESEIAKDAPAVPLVENALDETRSEERR